MNIQELKLQPKIKNGSTINLAMTEWLENIDVTSGNLGEPVCVYTHRCSIGSFNDTYLKTFGGLYDKYLMKEFAVRLLPAEGTGTASMYLLAYHPDPTFNPFLYPGGELVRIALGSNKTTMFSGWEGGRLDIGSSTLLYVREGADARMSSFGTFFVVAMTGSDVLHCEVVLEYDVEFKNLVRYSPRVEPALEYTIYETNGLISNPLNTVVTTDVSFPVDIAQYYLNSGKVRVKSNPSRKSYIGPAAGGNVAWFLPKGYWDLSFDVGYDSSVVANATSPALAFQRLVFGPDSGGMNPSAKILYSINYGNGNGRRAVTSGATAIQGRLCMYQVIIQVLHTSAWVFPRWETVPTAPNFVSSNFNITAMVMNTIVRELNDFNIVFQSIPEDVVIENYKEEGVLVTSAEISAYPSNVVAAVEYLEQEVVKPILRDASPVLSPYSLRRG